MFNTILIHAYLAATRFAETGTSRMSRVASPGDEKGQASAEYALVLLGAALLAIFLGKWLLEGGTLKQVFGNLLDTILGKMPA